MVNGATIGLMVAAQSSVQARARHAVVHAVDPNSHSVKVLVQPEGSISGWLPDPGLACAGLKISCPAEIGTQVLVVPVEGDAEHPVIVARLFDATCQPPISPATGKPVQPGEIGVFLDDGTFLHVAPGLITLKADLSLQGSLLASGDVVAGSISLQSHLHDGVAAGTGSTSVPIA